MVTAPIPAELSLLAATLAPSLAARFGFILAALRAVIAHRFLKPPHDAAIIVPVWKRLNRAAQRFAALMALFADGRLPSPRPKRPARTAAARPGGAKSPVPTRRAWLLRALLHEAAVYRGQLQDLLSEPGVADLLAITPVAGRIIRPLAHMLGFTPPAALRLPPRPRPARPKRRHPGRPQPPPAAPRHGDRPPPLESEPLPAWPPPATGIVAPSPWPSRWPLRQLLSESGPNCPRCRLRWPFTPHPDMKKPA